MYPPHLVYFVCVFLLLQIYTCVNISTCSSHAVTADVDIAEIAKAAEFFLSDGIIVTGQSTGSPADKTELAGVRHAVPSLPVLIGSGVTAENVDRYSSADAVIVGSWFKEDGRWFNNVDRHRVTAFMNRVHCLCV